MSASGVHTTAGWNQRLSAYLRFHYPLSKKVKKNMGKKGEGFESER